MIHDSHIQVPPPGHHGLGDVVSKGRNLAGTGRRPYDEATMVVAAYARIAEDLRGKIASRDITPGGQVAERA
jgi:hypothetical protein